MASILVIDDSISVLDLLSQLLSEAGHQVITANSGKQGLKILRETFVNLVLTDIYMPERDGIEILVEVRKVHPDLPVVVMSSKPETYNMFSAAKSLGAVFTLKKPFSNNQLNEAVTAGLKHRAGAPFRPSILPDLAANIFKSYLP